MKYRHRFHAGNFADVHKHVTLLALLTALKRKDKGFLYLDTHAGRGGYDLSSPSAEAAAGIGRFKPGADAAPELREYATLLEHWRSSLGKPHFYPGSPLLALATLRAQDRAVLIERLATEAHALGDLVALAGERRGHREHHERGGQRQHPAQRPAAAPRVHLERGDGYARLRAWLPPPERRALTFLDPPYEETRQDFLTVTSALSEGLRRFPTGVFAAWYPIKDERTTNAWHAACARALAAPLLVSELWLYPRDARAALNGSGLLIVNPPWRMLERMQVWLPQLQGYLKVGSGGGNSARMLPKSPA
jgi:23S rRNA (adenine2030-N6)-methyltransferase